MNDIVRWCAEGKLSAHVHAVYPLAETATALKAIADRKVMGKIVLRPVITPRRACAQACAAPPRDDRA